MYTKTYIIQEIAKIIEKEITSLELVFDSKMKLGSHDNFTHYIDVCHRRIYPTFLSTNYLPISIRRNALVSINKKLTATETEASLINGVNPTFHHQFSTAFFNLLLPSFICHTVHLLTTPFFIT